VDAGADQNQHVHCHCDSEADQHHSSDGDHSTDSERGGRAVPGRILQRTGVRHGASGLSDRACPP
jgi:hypothetical protein